VNYPEVVLRDSLILVATGASGVLQGTGGQGGRSILLMGYCPSLPQLLLKNHTWWVVAVEGAPKPPLLWNVSVKHNIFEHMGWGRPASQSRDGFDKPYEYAVTADPSAVFHFVIFALTPHGRQ
jgi:hypothetical protein